MYKNKNNVIFVVDIYMFDNSTVLFDFVFLVKHFTQNIFSSG